MPAELDALTRGTNGLIFGYFNVLLPMLVGLWHGRARFPAFLTALLLAVPTVLVAAVAMTLVDSLLGVHGNTLLQFLLGVLVAAAVGYGAGRWLAARKATEETQHRRGAVVASTGVSASNMESPSAPRHGRLDPSMPVTLAGYPLTVQDETKHFKLIGTTGTGKSTAIRELLSTAFARGDRAIITDPDGGYLDTFYEPDRGDVILNPFARDSTKWSLFGEIVTDYDVDQLARSLIPDSSDPDTTWIEYARTLLTAIIQQLMLGGIKDDAEVYRLLTKAENKELQKLLSDTPAAPFLATEKMCHCIRSIASSALRAFRYTTRQQGTPFSVRQWVREGRARHCGGSGGVLFIPYEAGEIAALRSLISAWMRIAIFEAMTGGEQDRRLWFVIDELDSLGEIDGLKDALVRLRKYGGRCVLGLQSISQVSNTYRASAHAIVENCGNSLILRCSASEQGGTAEFASKLIGQREVLHTTQSRTRQPGRWRKTITVNESIRIEPAIMPSEIERLPDLEGFLKTASQPDWHRVKLTPTENPSTSRSRRPTSTQRRATPPATPPSSSSRSPTTPPSASSPRSPTTLPSVSSPLSSTMPRSVSSPRSPTMPPSESAPLSPSTPPSATAPITPTAEPLGVSLPNAAACPEARFTAMSAATPAPSPSATIALAAALTPMVAEPPADLSAPNSAAAVAPIAAAQASAPTTTVSATIVQPPKPRRPANSARPTRKRNRKPRPRVVKDVAVPTPPAPTDLFPPPA